MPRLIAFSGSDRSGSKNTQVLMVAVSAARSSGADVEQIRLSDYRLPLYDGDVEVRDGLPEGCVKLKALFKGADGFLIASPEYNSGYTPLLKNAIDWVSRPMDGEKPLEAFSGKVAGLVAASPGWRAGMRGLFQIREVLSNINMVVVPALGTVSSFNENMTDGGEIVHEAQRKLVEEVGRSTAALAGKLAVGG